MPWHRRLNYPGLCLAGMLLLIAAPRASLAEKAQVWTKLRSPNFIIITNGTEKQARRVAYQFEMIRAVLRQFLNLKGTATDPPVIIIAAKDEETLKPLLPAVYQTKGSVHLAGIYVGGPEKNYVALRLDASLNEESSTPYETVYHEYVHYIMRRSISHLPLWLTEGLAEFYGNTALRGKYVFVGTPSDSNLMVLHQAQMLPLSTLFAVNANSPYYHEENKASIFYAESWVLTHYLMAQDWLHNTFHLRQFVELLAENKDPEVAAKLTIGDPHALDLALRNYIGKFSFTAARIDVPPEIKEDAFAPESLSGAESLAVRGDFLLHNRRYPEARQMLEESLKLDPKLAAAYESMGQLYSMQNQHDEATKWYSQAVDMNSQSYLANYYYATSLFKGNLTDDLAAKAEVCLRHAIEINPEFAPSDSALAYLLAHRHGDLEEARMVLLKAVSLEPGALHYRLQMVQLMEQMDHPDDAVRVATLAVAMAKTPQEYVETQGALQQAQQFQESKRHEQEQVEAYAKSEAEPGAQSDKPPAEAPAPGEHEPPLETKPPELRHRPQENAPVNPALDAETPHRPELLARNEVADGTITYSRCPDAATLELTVTVHSGTRQLYSDNYYKIPFRALNFTPQGILNPCSDMKGMRAHVTFHPAKDHPEQGEIVGVELVK